MKKYRNCQSCGMPLKKDPNQGGTNADGSVSVMYCSYCYEDGVFKQADWNVEEMRSFVRKKLVELGFPGFLTGIFTRGIYKLERWKKA